MLDTLDRFDDLIANTDRYLNDDGLWAAALADPAARIQLRDSLQRLAEHADTQIRRVNDQLSRTPRDRHRRQERERLVRHKEQVIARIRQAKAALAGGATPAGAYDSTVPYQTLVYLIMEHKRATLAAEIDAEPHDQALWAVLDHVADAWKTVRPPTDADLAARQQAAKVPA